MSIQADVVTALAGVAGDNVFPEVAPEKYTVPLVIFVRTARDPLMTLTGPAGIAKYTYVFECYETDKAEALALSDDVRAAIVAAAATVLPTQFEEPVASDEYEQQVAEYMEPVSFSFWAP